MLPISPLAPPTKLPSSPSTAQLMETIAYRAFLFFRDESHPKTGLTKDRAKNLQSKDAYTIASTASTGYMLTALVIGVERGWISRKEAEKRALTALTFIRYRLPNVHGFYYHFINWETGKREWNCELSSIDSALLVLGVLAAGQYFKGDVLRHANAIYERMDWRWMQNRGALDPADMSLTMGWKPEDGFLKSRWGDYNEALYLYLLALGAPRYDLPGSTLDKWKTPEMTLEGLKVYGEPGPVFFAQMTPAYFNLSGKKDRTGRDFWTNFANAHKANHAYCSHHPELYPKHTESLWGITACDQPPPVGYGAQSPADGQNDGTMAPTGMLAGVLFVPEIAHANALDLYTNYREKIWGRYGFSNAFNVKKDWYDPDVIGIDLGMMLLGMENARTGLIWKLMASHPMTKKAYRAAGFAPS